MMTKRENRKVKIILEYNSDDACDLWALASYISECADKNQAVPANILSEFFKRFSYPAIEKKKRDLEKAKSDFKELQEKTIARFIQNKYFNCENKNIVRNLVTEVCKNMIDKKLNFWDAIEDKQRRRWICRTITEEIVRIRNAQSDEIQKLLTRYVVNSITGFMVHSFGFRLSNNICPSNKILTERMYKLVPDYEAIIKKSDTSFWNYQIDLGSETPVYVNGQKSSPNH